MDSLLSINDGDISFEARAAEFERQAKEMRSAARAAKKQTTKEALKDEERCNYCAKKKRCALPSVIGQLLCAKHSAPQYIEEIKNKKCRMRDCSEKIPPPKLYCKRHVCSGSELCIFQSIPIEKAPQLDVNICFSHLLLRNNMDLIRTIAMLEPEKPTKKPRSKKTKINGPALKMPDVEISETTENDSVPEENVDATFDIIEDDEFRQALSSSSDDEQNVDNIEQTRARKKYTSPSGEETD